MENRRRRDAQFWHARSHRRQIFEIVGLDAMAALERFGNAFLDPNAFDLPQEVRMPDRAPILAIGDALQSDLFLELGDVPNRAVFGCAQRLG